MNFKAMYRRLILMLLASLLAGCQSQVPTSTVLPSSENANSLLTGYEFPTSIDPANHYLLYLHGKIVEDQGLPAVSPDFGEYEYEAILQKLESQGIEVISEQRPKDTNGTQYAQKVVEQIDLLFDAGVPPENITVVGASKGAGIAATVSSLLKNPKVNFVLLGFCAPDTVRALKQNQVSLNGNVLAIRDSADDLSGPCEELFDYSEGKGLGSHEEITLHIGTGHGILYQPLDEWILPTVEWAAGRQLNAGEIVILGSLEQVDDYPLYTMRYSGSYRERAYFNEPSRPSTITGVPVQTSRPFDWGRSLFAALGDKKSRLLGRNFDWQFSPALLLFTDPPDGYASVSMVDIEYLGFGGDRSRNLTHLPLVERRSLLYAPSLPFDGMNENGLAVGMAAVPEEDMPYDPGKRTLDELEVIREILDHAGTVDEAIHILGSFNIDMGSVPIHYLIASASGDSALVEFYQGEMVVFRNESQWQAATNFLLASTNGDEQGQCWRYDLIEQRLKKLKGRVSSEDAFRLLEDVSQDITQWSIAYHVTSGELEVVMGRGFSGTIHTFHLAR